jgi:hypothetical protein
MFNACSDAPGETSSLESNTSTIESIDTIEFKDVKGTLTGLEGDSSTEEGVQTIFYVTSVDDPELQPGDTFIVEVKIDNVEDLFGYEYKLAFDPNIITCVEQVVGPFFEPNYFEWINVIEEDWCGLAVTQGIGETTGVSGSGVLALITFQVVGIGYSLLDLYYVECTNSSAETFYPEVQDGSFSNESSEEEEPGLEELALLVKRKAWPEHHHYSISKDEDPYNTLYGKVKNIHLETLYVQVKFIIYKDGILKGEFYSNIVQIAPEQEVDLAYQFQPDLGGYKVKAVTLYSLDNTNWQEGTTEKGFSFKCVK